MVGENRWDEKAGLRRDAVRSQVIDVLKAQIKRRPAMRRPHRSNNAEQEFFSTESDDWSGPGGSIELVLRAGRSGRSAAGGETGGRLRKRCGRHSGPCRAAGSRWKRDAFALGEPTAERVGARSDRGACAQRAFDWRESEERRSAGCANAGGVGEDRSAVVVSGEASQCESAGRYDGDPGTCGAGAGADGADQHGARTDEVLRGAVTGLQSAERECRESPGTEPGAEGRAGTVARRADRGAQRTDL